MDNGFKFIPPELGVVSNDNDNTGIGFGGVDNDLGFNSINNQTIVDDFYICNSCKSVFTFSNSTGPCFYCGSTNITKTNSSSYDAYYTLPFLVDENTMLNNYKKIVKTNIFFPTILKNNSTINKINKVYIPCKLYDLNINGNVQFTCCDEIDKTTKTPVSTYDASYSVNFDYNRLLVSNYPYISNDLINNINNYNFDNLVTFESVSSGIYYVNGSSEDTSKIKDLALKNSISIVRNNINHQFKKIKNNNIVVGENNNKSVLVPVYLMNMNYKGKKYFYIMNGQTGKIYFDFKVDILRVILISMGIFIGIFLILVLFTYIF